MDKICTCDISILVEAINSGVTWLFWGMILGGALSSSTTTMNK